MTQVATLKPFHFESQAIEQLPAIIEQKIEQQKANDPQAARFVRSANGGGLVCPRNDDPEANYDAAKELTTRLKTFEGSRQDLLEIACVVAKLRGVEGGEQAAVTFFNNALISHLQDKNLFPETKEKRVFALLGAATSTKIQLQDNVSAKAGEYLLTSLGSCLDDKTLSDEERDSKLISLIQIANQNGVVLEGAQFNSVCTYFNESGNIDGVQVFLEHIKNTRPMTDANKAQYISNVLASLAFHVFKKSEKSVGMGETTEKTIGDLEKLVQMVQAEKLGTDVIVTRAQDLLAIDQELKKLDEHVEKRMGFSEEAYRSAYQMCRAYAVKHGSKPEERAEILGRIDDRLQRYREMAPLGIGETAGYLWSQVFPKVNEGGVKEGEVKRNPKPPPSQEHL